MRVTLFGYLCRDRNILPDGTVSETVGGKGLFGAAAIARSGVDLDFITWLPEEDFGLLDSLKDYPIQTHVIPAAFGTLNTNEHRDDATLATTKLDVTPIEPANLTEEMRYSISESNTVLLAPDIEAKISLETIRLIANNVGVKLSVDIGKYFRTLQPNGELAPQWPWPKQAEYLRYFDTIFLSVEDVAVPLAQGESVLSLARAFGEQGPREIIITQGSRGAFVFLADTNEGFDIPSYPPKEMIDPTGAGDTFIGAYVAKRLETDSPAEAGHFAAMAASMKLNYIGPLRETAEEIERRLQELNEK